MVKLEDSDDLEEDENYPSKRKFVPTGDYRNRRILVWVQENGIRAATETSLLTLLPLATIRVANTEEKATEFLNKEEWDTFVVDLTEGGVSDSNFVKRVNNNPSAMLVAIHYPQLTEEGENSSLILESIRRLFELDLPKTETEDGKE
ncbi:hypothetical protein AGMMS49938_06440 [Fibrobacterales bacterium]|nr:hypothetical protein AGMMS49938_06440 [Fibrobacterales bacterium]